MYPYILSVTSHILPFSQLPLNRFPYLINRDQFHTNIIFAFIRELFARIARDMMADGRVDGVERLKPDVVARPKQGDGRGVHRYGDVHRPGVVRKEQITLRNQPGQLADAEISSK